MLLQAVIGQIQTNIYPMNYTHNFVEVILWVPCGFLSSIYPYSSGLLHWQQGNLTISLLPVKSPWSIWVKLTSIKIQQSKTYAYFMGCTLCCCFSAWTHYVLRNYRNVNAYLTLYLLNCYYDMHTCNLISSTFKRCDMAFIVPMHRDKSNITYFTFKPYYMLLKLILCESKEMS